MIQKIFRKASGWFLWFGIFVLAIVGYYNTVLFQEGNPLPILRATAKLETTQAEILPVKPERRILLQKAGPEDPLNEYMLEKGLSFKERLGSAIFYQDDGGSVLLVDSRMFTRRYIIYELSGEL